MAIRILTVALRQPSDLVAARQRARQLAEALSYPHTDQIAIATSVSEIARNAIRYASGGRVEFGIEDVDGAQHFVARVIDTGGGIPNLEEILAGRYVSETGMGLGLVGARRLMDSMQIDTQAGSGTTVTLTKRLPPAQQGRGDLGRIATQLPHLTAPDTIVELQAQNRELMQALADLARHREEVQQMARELEDTNRGVMALYAELDEKADSLRKADESKTRFLSNMSHEFRTPLSSVRALCKLLISHADGPLESEQETQVRFIARAVDDLTDLVNDLLDIAKIESGKIDVRPTEFTAADLFSTLRGMMRPLITPAVDLVFEIPGDIPVLRTDEGKVAQILRNFISNALKYTEHGRVTVSAHLSSDGRTVEFSVADTGIGIAPEHKEAIFEEFLQIPGALQGKTKGTGLGLPLCRKLAALLGGSVSVDSTLGKGSVFAATLPILVPSAHGGTSPAAPKEGGSQGFILVVEPDARLRASLEVALKSTGYEPFCVPSVAEAQDVMQSVRPAAVVIVGESGAELHTGSRWLRDLKGPGAVPVPVLVASAAADRSRAIEAGADWHVSTPYEIGEVTAVLERLLQARRDNSPVLIIDDDEAARYVLRKLLNTDSRVEEASDGLRGVELAERWKPRWIFLDLNMPGLQGEEVLDRLKADPKTADIPVVIVTARDLPAADRARLAPRVKAIISKNELSREALEKAMAA
ncbi:Sensor histidine kinase RcsC [Usitatibacter rugosus]|uniref:histidine kinase n=1 Tax=Usitatibacter rugosus TaxID=2732067 RepID=A0A6M4H2M2_9PROT|nr:ATP-binding protein [Usitatibacter rugosus]QJR12963.1 Sensor histidine kinase RcsC [Usitatibacter rugosus]